MAPISQESEPPTNPGRFKVGSSGFRIDIGVRDPDRPGQYLVAVECDGAAYHSAHWARERDRLRQDILENLGWRFHRIWSTDWFYNRAREMERLKAALSAARDASEEGIRVQGANHSEVQPGDEPEDEAHDIGEGGHPVLTVPAYVRADLQARSDVEPHAASVETLAEQVTEVVGIEGPIHVEEIARRITSAFGRGRTGNRIVEATNTAVQFALRNDHSLRVDGPFVMTEGQAIDPPVRNRSGERGNLTKVAYIAPIEIAAAARLVRQESGNVPDEELVQAIGRLLGFRRIGSDLRTAISAVLET